MWTSRALVIAFVYIFPFAEEKFISSSSASKYFRLHSGSLSRWRLGGALSSEFLLEFWVSYNIRRKIDMASEYLCPDWLIEGLTSGSVVSRKRASPVPVSYFFLLLQRMVAREVTTTLKHLLLTLWCESFGTLINACRSQKWNRLLSNSRSWFFQWHRGGHFYFIWRFPNGWNPPFREIACPLNNNLDLFVRV